ncbi:MAG: hypothetical protein R2932_07235 [Caldilineaceae bacterium]
MTEEPTVPPVATNTEVPPTPTHTPTATPTNTEDAPIPTETPTATPATHQNRQIAQLSMLAAKVVASSMGSPSPAMMCSPLTP